MNVEVADLQRLLARAGVYKGAIDGDAGPGTQAAVAAIEVAASQNWLTWTRARRMTAAAQVVLQQLGYPVGAVDGFAGPQTLEALTRWRSDDAAQVWVVERAPVTLPVRSSAAQLLWPRQVDVRARFGEAGGASCTAGRVHLPFPFRIAWDTKNHIRQFACHELVAPALTDIFARAADEIGADRMRTLGLDLYGGCYAHRPMRGGQALSMHSWGIAVDIDPARNQLRWSADRAQMARAEYVPWWNIVVEAGGVPAGYAWGRDWMHFQFARL